MALGGRALVALGALAEDATQGVGLSERVFTSTPHLYTSGHIEILLISGRGRKSKQVSGRIKGGRGHLQVNCVLMSGSGLSNYKNAGRQSYLLHTRVIVILGSPFNHTVHHFEHQTRHVEHIEALRTPQASLRTVRAHCDSIIGVCRGGVDR